MWRPRPALRRGIALAVTVTLPWVLISCGGRSDGTGSASDTRTAPNGDVINQADVRFATRMVPHHAQAVEMVTLTDQRPLEPAAQQLAEEIRAARVPEVETMVDWLTSWGEEVPETSLDHANAGHGGSAATGPDLGSDIPGLVTGDEMAALEHAAGPEFQDLWLQLMLDHHRGAVEMARAEQQDGRFPEAIELAESIESSQQEQIERIEQLLEE